MTEQEIIRTMTLEEKARICSGRDFWHLEGYEAYGIPSVMVTDGPHGVRKQDQSADHLGLNESVKATCFPPACLTASGWDRANLIAEGRAIADEAKAENVSMVLGPGVNMKRSPLCGRNFEYFSEDPFLAGEMGASWIKGVESRNVGTSLKHFAANSQEKARMTSNSIVDERALREIYLPAFEKSVKEGAPQSVMCAYNMVNGTYACQNPTLLDDILRKEWGFGGFVVTDWGAMDDRIRALKAGLELEMPGGSDSNEKKIIRAVEEGRLDMETLDRAVSRILSFILRVKDNEAAAYSVEEHHALARRIAAESHVLLENDGLLPLRKGGRYAVIGEFAKKPRFQGGGSSKINPHRVECAYDALVEAGYDVEYASGYDAATGESSEELIAEALRTAEGKDAAVVFIGLPDSWESEGFDRTGLELPPSMNRLVEKLAEKGIRTAVVLSCGSPVVMPWRKEVSSVLLGYIGGQASGGACADVLVGKVCPSGHLPETFPLSLEDTPAYGHFATDDRDVEYRESLLVGYRWYDWAGKDVEYPFGHGLSYTTFSYAIEGAPAWDDVKKTGSVSVKVENTGKTAGAALVQLYVGKPDSRIFRPVRELRGFEKVFLEPGCSKTVVIPLDARSFSYWSVEKHGWDIEDGSYVVSIGASSRDLRDSVEINVSGNREASVCGGDLWKKESILTEGKLTVSDEAFTSLFGGKVPRIERSGIIDSNSPLAEVLQNPRGQAILGPMLEKSAGVMGGETMSEDLKRMFMAMFMDMPLRGLGIFAGVSAEQLDELIRAING